MVHNDTIKKLEEIWKKLNDKYFNGELPAPVFYITPTRRSFLKYDPNTVIVFQRKSAQKYEVNVSTTILSLPIENICAELLHEMCHFYNHLNGIKDTSRNQTYHNKRFMLSAKRRGLMVEKDDKYGYAITAPSLELITWCKTVFNIESLDVYRYSVETDKPDEIHRTRSFRYICPACRAIARSTKPICLICGKCNYTMIIE